MAASTAIFVGGAINTPSPSSTLVSLFSPSHSSIVASSKLQDLPIPPPKLVDLWRIEGEDLDLHFHRAISPLSEWNPFDLVLEVPFVVFFFVLPLFSPTSICCFWWDLGVKDLSTSCVLSIALVASV